MIGIILTGITESVITVFAQNNSSFLFDFQSKIEITQSVAQIRSSLFLIYWLYSYMSSLYRCFSQLNEFCYVRKSFKTFYIFLIEKKNICVITAKQRYYTSCNNSMNFGRVHTSSQLFCTFWNLTFLKLMFQSTSINFLNN